MSGKHVILVGHSPNAKNDSPLDPTAPGSAGQRLFQMSQWPMPLYVTSMERINTLPAGWEDYTADQRRLRAHRIIIDGTLDDKCVIFVGKGTAEMYPWKLPQWGQWQYNARTRGLWTWVPHTSGLSRHWNDPAERRQLAIFFQNLRHSLDQAEPLNQR